MSILDDGEVGIRPFPMPEGHNIPEGDVEVNDRFKAARKSEFALLAMRCNRITSKKGAKMTVLNIIAKGIADDAYKGFAGEVAIWIFDDKVAAYDKNGDAHPDRVKVASLSNFFVKVLGIAEASEFENLSRGEAELAKMVAVADRTDNAALKGKSFGAQLFWEKRAYYGNGDNADNVYQVNDHSIRYFCASSLAPLSTEANAVVSEDLPY